MSTIEFACPYCERVTRVPAAFGGKQGKCPGCQKVIEVPAADGAAVAGADVASAPAGVANVAPPPPPAGLADVAPTPPVVVGGPVGDGPPPLPIMVGGVVGTKDATDDGGPSRPCPFCGESIKAAAKKCKFCGEFLDAGVRAQQRGQNLHGGTLASVWARFIDVLICWVPTWIVSFLGMMMVDRNGPVRNEPLGIALLGIGFVYFVASSFLQWYLITTRGQSIGKRMVGIKVVRNDGTPVDFVRGVILREWITFVIFMIPCYIGCLVNLVGYLLILGGDRLCLHDQVASTVVIEA